MSEPRIDPSVLGELQAQAGVDFVAELVATFADEGVTILAALRGAADAGDAPAFRRGAHSIKSNAIAFGATALAERARALELGGLPADAAPVDALAAEFDATIAELRARVRS